MTGVVIEAIRATVCPEFGRTTAIRAAEMIGEPVAEGAGRPYPIPWASRR